MASELILPGDDNKSRCAWCGKDPLYVKYHDSQWGRPVSENRRLFEKICLEGFQSGLSWITILRKRENFRAAFDNFEVEKVCKYRAARVEKLLGNAGIIRHRGKIEATINNAKMAREMIAEHGSLGAFFWKFEPKPRKYDAKRAITDESKEMSKQLKKLGWKFVGPTTCYSFMQALGIVNDHHPDCFRYAEVEVLRKRFRRPI